MDDTVKSIGSPAATRSLHDAVRKARVEEAYQLDETADRRDSEIARLELLKAELEAVFARLLGGAQWADVAAAYPAQTA